MTLAGLSRASAPLPGPFRPCGAFRFSAPPPVLQSAAGHTKGKRMSESNELEQLREEKVRRLREAGLDPYPARVERTHTSAEAVRAFVAAPEGTEVAAAVVGRLRSVRRMGKASFAHLEDGSGRIQIYLKQEQVGVESFERFHDLLDLGDFLQARGTLFRTKSGEVSLHAQTWSVLAKAILPLPAPKEEVVEGRRVVH